MFVAAWPPRPPESLRKEYAVPESWIPGCAVCEVLNTTSPKVPATTALHGVPICARHVKEVFQRDSSNAAKAVRRLAFQA